MELYFKNDITIAECMMKDWNCERLVLVVISECSTPASLAHTVAGRWMKMQWLNLQRRKYSLNSFNIPGAAHMVVVSSLYPV